MGATVSLIAALFGRLGVSSWGDPGPEARHFIDLSPNGVLIADLAAPDMPLTYVNRGFEQITGYSAAEAIGRNCRYLQGEDHDQPGVAEARAAIAAGRDTTVVLRNFTREGRMFWNELSLVALRDRGGRPTHYMGIMRDVTALRDAQHRREVAATIDRLTGALNRYAFIDRLNQLIEPEGRLLVVKLDIAGFNLVNSGYGHEAGDAMLVQIATRLRRLDAEAVGRVGSNEFAVAIRLEPGTSARKKLGLLKGTLAPRYTLPGVPADVEVQMAIGYVVGEDGADGTTLFRRAGTALAESKATPLRETREFDRATANAAKRRVRLIGDIQQGVANREFLYYYQPKVDLQTGEITGAEALLRWRRPNGMLMLPAEFIDVAEDSGLITDIGAVSFPGVAACVREINATRETPLPLSINVSMTTFRHPRAVEWLGRVITDSGVDPHQVTLELTEGIMAESSPEVIERFRELRALGFGLSIDDFGTGYSSLRYLESFPVSEIKIDRSFVTGLTPDSQKRHIVDAIVRIGLALGATVVGEGVETEAEAQMLRDLACAEAQGFYFARPMPAADFLKLMKDR